MERYDSYFSPLYKLAEQLKADMMTWGQFSVQHDIVDNVYVVGYDDSPVIKDAFLTMVPEIITAVGSTPEHVTIFKYDDRNLVVVVTDDSIGLLEITSTDTE